MKLVIAIVQDEDAGRLIGELMNEGYGVTKLATTGGFLKSGNTTLLIGLDDERFDECMKVIERICKSRKQITSAPVTHGGTTGMYAPYPIEVSVGGATVFVLSVDQFVKF
ncbi:MAG: cyclic-di-AMP receptor [Clostridia bacterium]|nr:cyclic-di-AMP receptor [Clostridia bacterium]